jgi:hypothetical protein
MRVLAAAITLADRERFIVSWFMAYRQTSKSKDSFDIRRLRGPSSRWGGQLDLAQRKRDAQGRQARSA